jgi:hypothetical protein
MKVLEGGEPAAPTALTAEEEEELLYGSEDETPPTEEEMEKARLQAEKEAEEADLLAKTAELQERIRRRKAERKQRLEDQQKLEKAAMLAEQERLREAAEAEKEAHRQQIERLEEQLRQARSGSSRNEGEEGEDEMDDERPVYQKRDRSGSDDSRHESVASSSMGANRFNLPAGYRAVRSAKLNSLAVRHLNGGSAIPFKPIGSFTDEKDARIKLANTISDANSSRNISSSFNLESFICNTCTSRGEHVVLGKKIDGDDGTKQSPPCFVLSDQNFPAVLPVEGEGDCFKILLVENASLSDLTTVLLAALEGFTVPAGTVVLISSVSHLAAVGTAAYAEDLVRACKAVRAVYGNGITVMHGIPLLLSGLHCYSTIRSLLEIGTWYKSITSLSTKELSESLTLLDAKLRESKQQNSDTAPSTPENIRAPERFLLKMPQSLLSYEKQICVSEGFGDQLSLCQPIEEGDEYELLNTMIEELNSKCGLELSQEYSLYRPSISSEPERPEVFEDELEKVIMVGASHSSRMTDELDDTCLEVVDISVRGWRLSEKTVEEKVKELTEIVSQCDEKRTTVVYQLYDNVSFFAKKADGTRNLPEKGQDGKFHVDGRLEVATRDEAKRMVSTSIPLLRAGGQCRKLVLTPGSRYRYNPCCLTRGHCSNLKERNYGKWMEEKLSELKSTVRDYVRMRNIKRATVMELGQLIKTPAGQSEYLHEEEIWGDDPVHMTRTGYKLAAAGIESLVYEKRGEEKEAEEKSGQRPTKKPRLDPALNRPSWISGSVSEAVRMDQRGLMGPPPPYNKWRGSARPYGASGFGDAHYSMRGRGSGRGRGSDRGRGSERGRGAARGRGPYRGQGRPW